MPPVTIVRTPIVDDDKTGTTGTSLDNAWKQQFYDQIDGALAKMPVDGGTPGKVPDSALSPNVALKNIDNAFVQQTLASGSVISGANGLQNWIDTAAPADKKRWRVVNYQDGSFHLEALNDANSTVLGRISFLRNGGIALPTGGSLQFPAAAVPNADANTLDDYEEGVWTPTLTFNGGSVGQTYSDRAASYVKVGAYVFLFIRIVCTNKGTSTGTAGISGLPFAESGSLNAGGVVHYYANMHTSIVAFPSLYINGQTLTFVYPQAGTISTLTDVHFIPGTILGVISYRAL